MKSVPLIFLSLVSIGRVFQLFGLFFEFENCLYSQVWFGAKRERSVTCDTELSSTNQKAPFMLPIGKIKTYSARKHEVGHFCTYMCIVTLSKRPDTYTQESESCLLCQIPHQVIETRFSTNQRRLLKLVPGSLSALIHLNKFYKFYALVCCAERFSARS